MGSLQTFGLVLAWCLIVAGCWLGWQLLRQNGRMLLRLDELQKRLDELEFGEESTPAGLPLDSTAPEFALPDLEGKGHTLQEYRGKDLLLIFFNPACGFCREMMPKLSTLRSSRVTVEGSEPDEKTENRDQPGSVATVAHRLPLIISAGDIEKNRQFFAEHKVSFPVLLQKEMEVAAAYQANGTPTGYLINKEGKIASRLTIGAEALQALLEGKAETGEQSAGIDDKDARFSNRSLARSKIKRDGLKAGTPAPNFRLPRLDGRGELSLEQLLGKRVLLVFSDPHCGPCNLLARRLEEFHRGNPQISLVIISSGDPKENRAKVKEHGLSFPVLLQQQWEISRLYAMFATPVAYLIDESGVITRDVSVGLEPIQQLMTEANKLAPAPASPS